jgi:hypothetical protein
LLSALRFVSPSFPFQTLNLTRLGLWMYCSDPIKCLNKRRVCHNALEKIRLSDGRNVDDVYINDLLTLARSGDRWIFRQITDAIKRFRENGQRGAARTTQKILDQACPGVAILSSRNIGSEGQPRVPRGELDHLERGSSSPSQRGDDTMMNQGGGARHRHTSTTRSQPGSNSSQPGSSSIQPSSSSRQPVADRSSRGGSGASEAGSSNQARSTARVAGTPASASGSTIPHPQDVELVQQRRGGHGSETRGGRIAPSSGAQQLDGSTFPASALPQLSTPPPTFDLLSGSPVQPNSISSQRTTKSSTGSQPGSAIAHFDPPIPSSAFPKAGSPFGFAYANPMFQSGGHDPAAPLGTTSAINLGGLSIRGSPPGRSATATAAAATTTPSPAAAARAHSNSPRSASPRGGREGVPNLSSATPPRGSGKRTSPLSNRPAPASGLQPPIRGTPTTPPGRPDRGGNIVERPARSDDEAKEENEKSMERVNSRVGLLESGERKTR